MVADARGLDNGKKGRAYLNEEDTKERVQFRGGFSGRERNHFFRRIAPGKPFADLSYCSGLDFSEDGRAVVPIDFDQDGDLDLVTLSLRAIRVMMNLGLGSRGNYLRIEFDDIPSSLGAQVRVWTGGTKQVAKVALEAGFHSQSSGNLHFGLGRSRVADRVHVTWPDGSKRIFQNLTGHVQLSKEGKVRRIEKAPWRDPPRPRSKSLQQSVKLLNGKTVDLVDKYVPTVVNFWAPWCKACVREFPQLNKLAARNKESLKVIGVSVETEDLKQVRNFMKKHKATFDSAIATDDVIEAYFGADGKMELPATFVFDRPNSLIRVFRSEVNSKRILQSLKRVELNAEDFRGLGVSADPGQQDKEMLLALSKSVALDNSNPMAHWRLGKALYQVKKYEDARASFQKAHSLSGEDPEILVDLAITQLRLEKTADYRQTIKKAVSVGTSARAHNEYGLSLEEKDDLESAATEFRKSLKINPDYFVALQNLRRIRAKQRNGPAVRQLTEELHRLGHVDPPRKKQKPAPSMAPQK